MPQNIKNKKLKEFVFLIDLFKKFCKDTNRSGGVLVGSSLGEYNKFLSTTIPSYMKVESCEFTEWVAANCWYKNSVKNEWYQIPRRHENKTTEELYEIYYSELH